MGSLWYPKQSPVQGLTGLWGGLSSNLTGGGGAGLYDEPLLTNGTGIQFRAVNNSGNQLKGYLGPAKADLRSYYTGTASWASWVNDDDYFNTTTTGIQVWHVPVDGTYEFTMESPSHHETAGSAGSSGAASGYKLKFNYDLSEGDRLFILPGQRCFPTTDGNTSMAGNGGTFLVKGDNTESNLDTDLLACDVADCIAVCGGAACQNNSSPNLMGTPRAPGSHPSGSDLETATNNGTGRGVQNYHNPGGGGPSGGAGFLRGACQHNTTSPYPLFVYAEKGDSTSFVLDADSFVRGGRGGKGYLGNTSSVQSNSGMNGSGGFRGGGGQTVGNSYQPGAGGMMGLSLIHI